MRAAASPWSALPARSVLPWSLVVLGVYALVGAATLSIGQYAGLASPVWPAAGLAFAVVYEWGWRMAPAVVAGSFVANIVTLALTDSLTMTEIGVASAIALGAALQAVAASWLVVWTVGHRASLSGGTQIVAFLLLAGPLACLINSTVATGAQVAAGLVSIDKALLVGVTWWAGDAIGVVVFAPLVLMLLPGQREVWAGRRARVAIPSLIGVALFVGFFAQADVQTRAERQMLVAALASDAAGELERNVARHQEVLEGMSSFFESSQLVDVEEFSTYASGALERFPNLQALSWNPLLAAEELVAFEQNQRVEQGLDGYTVTERNANGELVPVGPREEYVVVAYIEPIAGNEQALGFDINSNPARQEAIARARELGVAAATAPIDLIQEAGTQKGMLALVPVYEGGERPSDPAGQRAALRGFAVGVYRLGDLLNDTFSGPGWRNVQVELVDVTDPASPEEVAVRVAPDPPTVDLTATDGSTTAGDEFSVYGRNWRVEVTPTSGALANPTRAVASSIDVLGLVLLTLLQAFILLVTGNERAAVRRAEDASVEASTDELTGLQNRRAFMRTLTRVGERTLQDSSSDVLLYIDLDRFKSVNDHGGHEAGDRLLQAVARALRVTVRSRDVVARLGGDEFAVILNNCDMERGVTIAHTLVTTISAQSVSSDAGPLSVGVSIGVVLIDPALPIDIDELVRRADNACYTAKNRGGGVFVHPVAAVSEGLSPQA